MKYFSIPADFKQASIDKYYSLNDEYEESKIIETYGQLTESGTEFGSGRAADHIPTISKSDLQKYIEYSTLKKIDFNYTLNTTCFSNNEFTEKGIKQLLIFLEELYEIGVKNLTIALPSMMELVMLSKYKFNIKASTVCNIINPDKALSYKNIGVERIVVDESINRDFETLEGIRIAFGEKVELIVNVICLKNCIYRMFHHNQMSHDNIPGQASTTYYSHRCMMKRSELPSNLIRMNFIRPEDIKHYVGIGIHYFKIQGRQAAMNGDIYKCVKSYFSEEYDGNLLDLLNCFTTTNSFSHYIDNKKLENFIIPFIKQKGFCKNNCNACNYCDQTITRCANVSEIEQTNHKAKLFYENFDQYKLSILELNKGE